MKQPSDNEIMRALVGQVMKATPAKGSELDVTTFITKPMWKAFLRATKTPVNSKPSEWKGTETIRVFGSKTIVINSKKLQSMSFSITTEILAEDKTSHPSASTVAKNSKRRGNL